MRLGVGVWMMMPAVKRAICGGSNLQPHPAANAAAASKRAHRCTVLPLTCSKLFSSKISKPNMSRMPTKAVEGARDVSILRTRDAQDRAQTMGETASEGGRRASIRAW